MAKKIQETPTNLTREELSNLSRVTTDVFFSVFLLCDTPSERKGSIRTIPVSKSCTIPIYTPEIQYLVKVQASGYYRTYIYVLLMAGIISS